MHELGIVFNVIKTVEEVAEENSLSKVQSVTLEIGEVSGVVPMFLQECWPWAVKDSKYLKDSELKVDTLQAVTICEDCQKTYETMKYAKICPYCKSEHTYLVTGNEVGIKEIEAC